MAWIKRNLYFLIGTVVAVLLLGGAGWYLYSKLQLNNELLDKLNEQYAELDRLNKENPHPGRGPIDNIKKAREERDQLKDLQKKGRQFFVRAPAIPEGTKVSGQDFTAALRLTIDQLQRGATNASVGIPPDYSFSFEAEKHMVRFSGSLDPLAVQLGEVKALCDILFQAKINALDALRRERVSPDDTAGPASDYVNQRSTTNELGVIAPYEISFRCFTAELAAVLAGLAGSPNAFLVKTMYVELAPAVVVTEVPMASPPPTYMPQPFVPTAAQQAAESASRDAAMKSRYGLGPGGRGSKLAGGAAQPVYQPQPTPGVAAPGAAAPPKGGLSTALDERQLRVTMHINLVKLAPQK